VTPSAFDVALDVRAALGECPVWFPDEQALRFVDIKGKALHRFVPATGAHRVNRYPEEIGCFAGRRGGGFVAGMRSGIWRLDTGGWLVQRLAANPEDTAWSRFNDGRTDPAGRFLAGTMDEPKTAARAHLYRFDRRGLGPLVDGVTTSNGLAFSPDGRTMYHADTPTFTVNAYDYDVATGAIAGKRPFVRLDPDASDRGRPDGAAVDADGCYWLALYEGGRVHRYDPDGRLMASYPVPARCPTMPAFGGPDLRTLYVTSARAGRPDGELAERPYSGSLFAMAVDTPGLPSVPYDPAVGGEAADAVG
jgi:sugar lactone lactonase YvrE